LGATLWISRIATGPLKYGTKRILMYFWKGSQAGYLNLYRCTAKAIKKEEQVIAFISLEIE